MEFSKGRSEIVKTVSEDVFGLREPKQCLRIVKFYYGKSKDIQVTDKEDL